MDRQHFRKVQYKAEVALFASMKRRQRKLATTPMGLPSSDVLWRSLRLQLMGTLQRFASERKLTITEAKEMLLRTQLQDLTMEEQCWLESARNLVSIMAPSTETETNITPQTLLALAAADPLPPSLGLPPLPSTSTSSRATLPSVAALIHAIFLMDPSPTPASALPYPLATKRPHSAIPMAP